VLRSLTATLCGFLAAVLLPLSLLSVWVNGVVSDTDTYVETVTPLADDDAVKAAAVDELDRAALQLVASSGVPLPTGGETLVRLAVQQVVNGEVFRAAWAQANRIAHRQVVAVLEDRGGARLDDRGRVTIDLNPVFDDVARNLAAQGLAVPDPTTVDASFPVMSAAQLAKARRAYDALDTLGFWLPLAWVATLALTLLLARRRVAATVKVAVASLVATGLLALALVFARDAVTEDLPQRDVAVAVWDVVVADLWHQIALCAAGLVAVAVVSAVVAGLLGRARTPPGESPGGEQRAR